jgi:hypothetical protein
MGKVVCLVVLGLLVLSFGGCGLYGLGCVNNEVNLRYQVQAQSDANEASLDAMWKILKQQANITKAAVKDIKEINKINEELVQGRSGGALFKMVTENYPDLKQEEVTKLYGKIMASVEALRTKFKNDQIVLVDMISQRKTLIGKPVSGFWIKTFGDEESTVKFMKRGDEHTPAGHPIEFQYTWVLSKATKGMVATGEEEIGDGPGLFDE